MKTNQIINRQQFIKSIGVSSLIIPAFQLFSFAKPQEEPQLDKAIVQK